MAKWIVLFLLKEHHRFNLDMNNIEHNIKQIEQHIKMTLEKHFDTFSNENESIPVHNHLPICGIVSGCEYCELYGNIFESGPMKLESLHEIKNHLYCLNNNLKKK
jgi:hypothetical protein